MTSTSPLPHNSFLLKVFFEIYIFIFLIMCTHLWVVPAPEEVRGLALELTDGWKLPDLGAVSGISNS